ncbi:MAG: hypothetical protein ACTSQI_04810 [Candidatus Helarchaeota archaeon]
MDAERQTGFYEIVKDISSLCGTIIGTRPYVGIIDGSGTIHYRDDPLEEYIEFIKNFCVSNFHLLNVGDHSLPLGGINLAFFKISEKAVVILYIKKGRSGQLLAFKAHMDKWTSKINELIGEITILSPSIQIQPGAEEPEPEIFEAQQISKPQSRGLRTIPILMRKLTGKEKFPLDVATVFQYCDGEHSIEEICQLTDYPRLKVDNIIRIYQKKKWVEVKRML